MSQGSVSAKFRYAPASFDTSSIVDPRYSSEASLRVEESAKAAARIVIERLAGTDAPMVMAALGISDEVSE